MIEAIKATNVVTAFGDKIMHDNVSFHINKAEIYGFLGSSGSGKTTLMKTLVYLKEPKSGEILMFGEDMWKADEANRQKLRLESGFMFQFGALYSSMNVIDNVSILLREYSKMSQSEINDLASFWIQKVGLKKESATKFPSELSGGMKKRVALARALVLSPKILFLDEPNSGLDPISAREIDRLVCNLRDSLGITIAMTTHDVDTIFDILDRFLIIHNHKIPFEGTLKESEEFKDNPLAELFKMRQK